MTILWQSSWFWLMICTVLFFLAGCVMLGQQTGRRIDNAYLPGQTDTPLPTLLPQNMAITPLDPDVNFHIFQPGISRYNSSSPEIVVDPPSCFSLSSGELSCPGQIWNNTEENVGDTRVQLAFFDESGHKIGEQTATSEQRIIPPGSFAPYRMTIEADLAGQIDATTHIIPSVVSFPPDPDIRMPGITDIQGMMTESGYYDLTVTIQNNSGVDVENIRLIAVLDGDRWGIVGYSVHEVENILLNGGQQSIHMEVIPHAIPRTIVHHLHVEAIIRD